MKHSSDKQDKEIIKLLKEDPQEAIVLTIQYYTGLVWAAAGHYLTNPEDIRECVNDTFAEFYRHRERFDDTKGSLPAFLSSIAKHQAISLYRKNKQQEAVCLTVEPESAEENADRTAERLDLEHAINALDTDDAEIIRMKYYGGMTVREIADSLHIPYETVKKRHQRSLGKLRLLLLGVLILLLTACLAACAYKVLQYFGVIPGYGINQSNTMSFYVLEEPKTLDEEQLLFCLESGVYSEDSMILTLSVEFRDAWYESRGLEKELTAEVIEAMGSAYAPMSPVLILEDGTVWSRRLLTSETSLNADNSKNQIQIFFEPLTELPNETRILPMTLQFAGREIPFTFCAAKEEEIDNYSYKLEKQGGLLAIPHLADGRLYIDIYPLNCGGYQTDPGLIRSVEETAGGPKGQVTVTGADKTVYIGECLSYRPYSGNAFFRWDFGPAEAGDYLLNVPYVYQTALLPENFSFTVSDAEPGIGQRLEIPGSTLTIASYSGEQPTGTDFHPDGDQENPALRRFLCFDIETKDPDRTLISVNLQMNVETQADGQYHYASSSPLWQVQENYLDYIGYAILMPEGYVAEPVTYSCYSPNRKTVTYRWNHNFSIPIHVKAEEEP